MRKNQTESDHYEGLDLEAMLKADNYYAWILDIVKARVGKNVVEVGAGVGSFSKKILSTRPKTLDTIEPAQAMAKLLKKNLDELQSKTSIKVHNRLLADAQKNLQATPDTFIYINVFEHIKDDKAELTTITNLLKPGGHAVIFVPALNGLMSDFDKSIGHYRRYNKKMLRDLCDQNGLEIVTLRYMDFIGMFPWWLSFKVLKRKGLSSKMVSVYDGFCVPIIRTIENAVTAPIGKNVLLVARKPKKS